jgi:hypothetical protein
MGIQAVQSTTAVDLTAQAQAQSSSASKVSGQKNQPAAQKAGGAPPAGGGAKPAAAAKSSSSSSSTAKIYDKRDANQDGVVSYQEEMVYAIKHPTDETQEQTAVSSSQMQSGLKAYQQGQQADGASTSSLSSAY